MSDEKRCHKLPFRIAHETGSSRVNCYAVEKMPGIWVIEYRWAKDRPSIIAKNEHGRNYTLQLFEHNTMIEAAMKGKL